MAVRIDRSGGGPRIWFEVVPDSKTLKNRLHLDVHVRVRVATDTCRHAGQADIIRELIDGAAGLTIRNSNLPSGDQAWWDNYRDRVERAAREAARLAGDS